MGLDVEQIKPEKALELLGDGDWHLKNDDENYPELIFDTSFRQNILDYASNLFVRWVISGREVEIYHHNDPSWDSSGSARTHIVDPLLLLVKYETMDDWMENASTGQSEASYVSGMGLFWITFGEEIEEFIDDRIYDLIKSGLRATYTIPEDDEEWEDWEVITWYMKPILMLWVSKFTTNDIWTKYEAVVRAKIEEETTVNEERQKITRKQQQLADDFWQHHFPDSLDKRLELFAFKTRRIRAYLKDVFLDTDPEIIKAIANVGVSGNFSVAVRDRIKQIAQEACE